VITDQNGGFATGVLRFFLWVLSLFYAAILAVRNLGYERGFPKIVDLGEPVISVGNITWGGVGKTPFVLFLAGSLKAQGLSPAILMRGYMKSAAPSDEAEIFRQELPGIAVGVGADRVKSAQQLKMKQPVDVYILDDGFQHRKVKRGLNIVLVDVNNPFGNGELIPRGILREPLAALKRADVIVLTKTDVNPSAAKALEERLKRIHPSCSVAWAAHRPQLFVDLLSGEKVALTASVAMPGPAEKAMSFCGIGDPEYFVVTLAELGIETQKNFAFADHHVYSEADIGYIVADAKKAGIKIIFTTAKDGVKIAQFKEMFFAANLQCWILKIEFEIEVGKDMVLGRVHHLLGR